MNAIWTWIAKQLPQAIRLAWKTFVTVALRSPNKFDDFIVYNIEDAIDEEKKTNE